MTAESKGKVERSVSYVKNSFWAGVTFSDLADLNRQARQWCERINARAHRTTHARPIDRLAEEHLLPLPQDFAWERFATEDRKVTWDGYFSYDGVLYGLPGEQRLAGKTVQVRERRGTLTVWHGGTLVLTVEQRSESQACVPHPGQWEGVASVAQTRQVPAPLAHQKPVPEVVHRPLSAYEQLAGWGDQEGLA